MNSGSSEQPKTPSQEELDRAVTESRAKLESNKVFDNRFEERRLPRRPNPVREAEYVAAERRS